MLIAAFGLSEMNRMKPKMVKAEVEQAKTGAELFQAAGCVNCHGTDGKAMIADAKDLSISQLSDDEIKSAIMNGKNAMAAYKKVLSDSEITQLSGYVKTLRK